VRSPLWASYERDDVFAMLLGDWNCRAAEGEGALLRRILKLTVDDDHWQSASPAHCHDAADAVCRSPAGRPSRHQFVMPASDVYGKWRKRPHPAASCNVIINRQTVTLRQRSVRLITMTRSLKYETNIICRNSKYYCHWSSIGPNFKVILLFLLLSSSLLVHKPRTYDIPQFDNFQKLIYECTNHVWNIYVWC